MNRLLIAAYIFVMVLAFADGTPTGTFLGIVMLIGGFLLWRMK